MNRLMKYSEIWHEQVDKEFKKERVNSSQNEEVKALVIKKRGSGLEITQFF